MSTRLSRLWRGLESYDVPSLLSLFGSGGELKLDAINAIDAVNEEDENEDEGNLHPVLDLGDDGILRDEAIHVRLAVTSVEVERGKGGAHVKILRLTLKGSGTIRSMNSPISNMRRMKTCWRCTVSAWDMAEASKRRARGGTTYEGVVERHDD